MRRNAFLGTRRLDFPRIALPFVLIALFTQACAQQTGRNVRLDFTNAETVSRWEPTHDVSRIEAIPEGMRIHISGGDPYISGPPLDPPQGTALWIRVRLFSEQSGTLQVFYFRTATTEEHSARTPVPAKRWVEVAMPVPELEPGTRLRIDPPGIGGTCTISWLELAPRSVPKLPKWSPPSAALKTSHLRVQSGPVTLLHDAKRLAKFSVFVSGYLMAAGWDRMPIAYDSGKAVRWFDPAATGKTSVKLKQKTVRVSCRATDPDGGQWDILQTFAPDKRGGITVTASIAVSKPRSVYFIPALVLFPGHGSFGRARERGLFAGVEYLDPPDQSSSQADLRGEQAQRLVPDQMKLTFPLMVMQAKKRYVALTWTREQWLAAAYDTPDRSFGSMANAMGLIVPGSDGTNRSEGSLLPYAPLSMRPGAALKISATIFGGNGESVIPAVQRYVSDLGLPPIPPTGMDRAAYARWAAGGWLDSRIREGARYRHAYWPGLTGFSPQAAADPALWMEWLAGVCGDAALAQRLHDQVDAVLDVTDPADRNNATVSHVTYPVQALAFGDAATAAERARSQALSALSRFEQDGTVIYRPSGGTDYGATHFARHANGLTAPIVVQALQNALYCGDRQLIKTAIERLRALDRYVNSAPRGAQTWEVPLHTPDILASAHLVKAYTLGYEITGDTHFLNMARHWAWTGVPFVYLVKPTDQPVGLYATPPVLGATNWVAPNWMGLPVQWCGLVYADALYRLSRYDNPALWRTLAKGITASGVQQSWPSSDRDLQGLLPDSFTLRSQNRNAVAINPGTVQANAVRLYGGPEVFDYRCFRQSGLTVHAPGALDNCKDGPKAASFTIHGWTSRPYFVLIHGIKPGARITVNGAEFPRGEKYEYDSEAERAVLQLTGSPHVSVQQ